jgi:predicted nucleic-acid-binding Zn-ribbon protein
MKSGICPKCGSDKIYTGTGAKYGADGNNYFAVVRNWLGLDKLAFVRRYVCANCHYMETYIADDESMKHILEGFEPLNKEKRKNGE